MVAAGERIKLALLSLLLLLMLGMVCFAAVSTFQAVRNFQQQNKALEEGDVSTIRAWMTLHVIARLYRVPEDYLSRTLAISNPEQVRHFTLNQIASTKRQPVTRVIQTLQRAILSYRKTHPTRVKAPGLYQKLTQQRNIEKTRIVKPVRKPIGHSGAKFRLLTTGRT